MYVVYALVDPRDEAVHYVGFTEDVYRRFLEHIQGSGTNYEKNKWVFDMREANIMIQMRHLEETEDIEHARIREEYWIKHYKMLKDPLSNMKNVHIKKSKSHIRTIRKIIYRDAPQIVIEERHSETEMAHLEEPFTQLSEPFLALPENSEDGPILGKDDMRFSPGQEEEFVKRYNRTPDILTVFQTMPNTRGGIGLGKRYYKCAKWVIEHKIRVS